jgi:flagellar hook-associated protein 2
VSSPITLSGFNQIDFNLVLNAVMQQASLPLTALQDRQSALRSQLSTFDTLTSRISALRSAADALGNPESVSTMAGTSSDPARVGVSVGNDATAGDYDIVVTELARAQVTASASTSPDANTTIVASGGTITIGGVAVTLAGDTTLQGLASAINDTDGIGVSAAVVRTSPDNYRLVLTSKATGLANAFTVTNGLSGGTGVTFTDTDNNGTAGDSVEDNAVNASDASLLVNNIPVTGPANVFDDVVPGVTITAVKKDPDATVHVGVAPDGTDLKTKVETFITAYNDIVKFVNDQRTSAAGGLGNSIGREPMLRQLHASLRRELLGPHGAAVLTRLAEVGVEFTRNGTLELDNARFTEAIETDGEGVRALFAGTDGAFRAVESVLDEYAQADGFIATAKDRLNKQIASMDAQIVAMQVRLAQQRATLQREFTEADAAMSRLKAQASSLGGIASGFGSF